MKTFFIFGKIFSNIVAKFIIVLVILLVLGSAIGIAKAETFTNYYPTGDYYDDDSLSATTSQATLVIGGADSGDGWRRTGYFIFTPTTDYYGAPVGGSCAAPNNNYVAYNQPSGYQYNINWSAFSCYGWSGITDGNSPPENTSGYLYWYGTKQYSACCGGELPNRPEPIAVTVGEIYNPFNPQEPPIFDLSAPLIAGQDCRFDENGLAGADQFNTTVDCGLFVNSEVDTGTYNPNNWSITWQYEVYLKKGLNDCTRLTTNSDCTYLLDSGSTAHVQSNLSSYILYSYPGILWPNFANGTYQVWATASATCQNAEVCGTNNTTTEWEKLGDFSLTTSVAAPITEPTGLWGAAAQDIKNLISWLFVPQAGSFGLSQWNGLVDNLKTKAPFGWFVQVANALSNITFEQQNDLVLTIPAIEGIAEPSSFVIMPSSGSLKDSYETYCMPLIRMVIWGAFVLYLWHRFKETTDKL